MAWFKLHAVMLTDCRVRPPLEIGVCSPEHPRIEHPDPGERELGPIPQRWHTDRVGPLGFLAPDGHDHIQRWSLADVPDSPPNRFIELKDDDRLLSRHGTPAVQK